MSSNLYTKNPNINQTLIILVGIPAAGKTYFATEYVNRHPNTVIISRDDLRYMFYKSYVVPDYIEKLITISIQEIFQISMEKEFNIILDQTNCREHDFKSYLNFAKDKMNIEFYIFDIDLVSAKQRNRRRNKERMVRESDMDRMWINYQNIRQNCKFGIYGDINILNTLEDEFNERTNLDQMYFDMDDMVGSDDLT